MPRKTDEIDAQKLLMEIEEDLNFQDDFEPAESPLRKYGTPTRRKKTNPDREEE